MKKNGTFKRFLAFLLCAAMMITYMPSSVYTLADETGDEEAVEQEVKAPAEPKASGDEQEKASEPEPAQEPEQEPAEEDEKPEATEPASEANEISEPTLVNDTPDKQVKKNVAEPVPEEVSKSKPVENGSVTKADETVSGTGSTGTESQKEQDLDSPSNIESVDDSMKSKADAVPLKATDRSEEEPWVVDYYSNDTDTEPYRSFEYEKEEGQTLGTLPSGPNKDYATFKGWAVRNTTELVTENTPVTGNMDLVAQYDDMITVTFKTDEGEMITRFTREEGQTIGTMPESPFKEGSRFVKWVLQGTDTEVTADTVVNDDMVIIAVFKEIDVYTVTANYYYVIDGNKHIFGHDIWEIDDQATLPMEFTVPATTKVDHEHDPGTPTYYASQSFVTVTQADVDNAASTKNIVKEVEFVEYTAEYYYVYKLKDLDGDGYTEIPNTRETVHGVLGSTVYPQTKSFEYADLESANSQQITQPRGQELEVLYTRKNFDLTFDTVGGSYVSTQILPYGTTVNSSDLETPTKDGYDFDGWYTDPEYSNNSKVTGTITINDNTTLYAKWKGKPVSYKIVYLFEKYDDTGTTSSFVFEDVASATANVGSTVVANGSYVPNKNKKGWEKDNDKNSASSAIVKADGSTVLNVYYKLTEYTFNFDRNGRGWIIRPNGTTTTDLYSFKAKLGQDISRLWPSADSNSRYFGGWARNNSEVPFLTKQLILGTDLLPTNGASVTFFALWNNRANLKILNYYLENADNDGYTKSDDYSQTLYANGNPTNKEILGYTFDHSQNSGNTFNFYYKRNRYDITYYDGGNQLKVIEKVKFDADISGSSYNYIPEKPAGKEDYTWGGWHSDAGLTTPYTFNKMPASPLVVYAKWIPPTYTVSFDSQEGTPTFDSKTVEKNQTVEYPGAPEKEHFVFKGWYTEAEGGELYDWAKPVTEDTVLYAHYAPAEVFYTVHYIDGETETKLFEDKVVRGSSLVVGQQITESANTLSGYRPDAVTKTITLDYENNEITFVYSKKSEITSYRIEYVLAADHDVKVHAPTIKNNVDGSTVSVIATPLGVDKTYMAEEGGATEEQLSRDYYPTESEKELVLSADPDNNVFYFEYEDYHTATIVVQYFDMAGNPIPGHESHTEKVRVGSTYTVTGQDAPEGFSYHHSEDDIYGSNHTVYHITTGGTFEIRQYYQKKLTITANNKQKPYDGTALTSSGVADATAEGLSSGHTLSSIQYSGSQTQVGSSKTTPKNAQIQGAPDNYYQIKYVKGNLTVTQASVTVYITPDRYTNAIYNGTEYEAGFCNPDKQSEDYHDYLEFTNDDFKSEHLDAFVSVINANKVLLRRTDVGTVSMSEQQVAALFAHLIFIDNNYNVTGIRDRAERHDRDI